MEMVLIRLDLGMVWSVVSIYIWVNVKKGDILTYGDIKFLEGWRNIYTTEVQLAPEKFMGLEDELPSCWGPVNFQWQTAFENLRGLCFPSASMGKLSCDRINCQLRHPRESLGLKDGMLAHGKQRCSLGFPYEELVS